MSALLLKRILALALLAVCLGGQWSEEEAAPRQAKAPNAEAAEARAIEFLTREVPAWSQQNGCFSCHNNGDGARALYRAAVKGYRIPQAALSETTSWVGAPQRWDKNKGDPGVSDQRLADIQFAASLLAAYEAGHVKDRRVLVEAARRLVSGQDEDGAWHIEQDNGPGSPATYGTPLATSIALRSLRAAGSSEMLSAILRAEQWFGRLSATNVPAQAALVEALTFAASGATAGATDGAPADTTESAAIGKRERAIEMLLAAQTRDGGWGPYADAPPEPFDTAVALIALSRVRSSRMVEEAIGRGRAFLVARQNGDGSWPETTRPPDGESYAQRLSTTGWATLALLATS